MRGAMTGAAMSADNGIGRASSHMDCTGSSVLSFSVIAVVSVMGVSDTAGGGEGGIGRDGRGSGVGPATTRG